MARPSKPNKPKRSKIEINANVFAHARKIALEKFHLDVGPLVEELLIKELIKDGQFTDGLSIRSTPLHEKTAVEIPAITAPETAESSQKDAEDGLKKLIGKHKAQKRVPLHGHASLQGKG